MDCHLWDQTLGKQGQNETSSILLTQLEAEKFKAEWIIVWADSCGRQNKHYMQLLLFYELVKTQMYKRIDYKFPQVKAYCKFLNGTVTQFYLHHAGWTHFLAK